MKRRTQLMIIWCSLVLAMIGLNLSAAFAAKLAVRLPNGLYVHKEVVSLKEARFKNMIRQKYDLSCGAASLATILNYSFNEEIEEIEIIKHMLEHGDKEKIAEKGFSLLDLKNYAEQKDYMAAGYKEVPVEKLKNLKVPAIILLTSGKYSHFVVLKGIRGDKVYVADPAFGNRSMNLEDFEKAWNKIIFVVVSKSQKPSSELALESTIPAPELDVIRIQQMGVGGFSSLPTRGEF